MDAGTHLRYDCWFCPEVRGRPDRDHKLYFSKEKEVGFCFKCGTAVVLQQEFESSEDILEDLRKKLRNSFPYGGEESRSAFQREQRRIPGPFRLSGWTVPVGDSSGRAYLESRGISVETASRFGVRFASLPQPGLVLPNRLQEDGEALLTDFYQLRKVDPGGGEKYLSPPDTIKPIAYLDHRSQPGKSNAGLTPDLFLTEGMLSAISLHEKLGVPVGALLGLSLTPHQLAELNSHLREFPAGRLFLVLDGGEAPRARKLASALEEKVIRCPELRIVDLPARVDPNEASRDQLEWAVSQAFSPHRIPW